MTFLDTPVRPRARFTAEMLDAAVTTAAMVYIGLLLTLLGCRATPLGGPVRFHLLHVKYIRSAQAVGVDRLWLNAVRAAGYVCRQAGAFHLDRPALLQAVALVATSDAYNF